MSFQTALLGFLILAPSTPVTHDFAGAQPGPPGLSLRRGCAAVQARSHRSRSAAWGGGRAATLR